MKYTVNFIFDGNCSNVLLIFKDRTIFKGRWNGVGGKFWDNETPEQCALREIHEETGLSGEDFVDPHPQYLGTLILPDDCATMEKNTCELYYFAVRTHDLSKAKMQPGETEMLKIFSTREILRAPVTDNEFAGNGDLQMFVNKALIGYGYRLL